jgi:hypothetical protein
MNYEHKALLFAEKYGIIKYEVKDHYMIFEESFPTEGTYICRVNLKTMSEERKLKRRGR